MAGARDSLLETDTKRPLTAAKAAAAAAAGVAVVLLLSVSSWWSTRPADFLSVVGAVSWKRGVTRERRRPPNPLPSPAAPAVEEGMVFTGEVDLAMVTNTISCTTGLEESMKQSPV